MKPTRRAVLLGMGGVVLSSAAAQAVARAEAFEVEPIEVILPTLNPAHDGLRIVQLSDLHIGTFTPDSRLISAVRAVNRLAPDVVVLTGDFITVKRDPVERVGELLGSLLDVPKIAVLGNHDHWTHPAALTAVLQRANIEVLRNQHSVLNLKDAPFRIIGVDDGRTRHDDPVASFKGVPETGSRLILTHAPSTANRLPPLGLLCLSGHTHGGHFVVPGVTNALMHMAGEPYVRGRYQAAGNQLYVNRGIGAGRGGHFPRAGAIPEVSLFTLKVPSFGR